MPFILRELRNEMTAKWQQFVNRLGLEQNDIDVIQFDYPRNSSLCLQLALHSWLNLNYKYEKHGRPSWRKIAEAVKDLDSKTPFMEIAKKHGKIQVLVVCSINWLKVLWQDFFIKENEYSYSTVLIHACIHCIPEGLRQNTIFSDILGLN